jgi:predicted transcriptional regulator
MKLTVQLDDQLLVEVQNYAVRTGQSVTAVIEDALRQMLSAPPVHLTTVDGNGLQPGVALDDSATLLELMETDSPVSLG